MRGKKFQRNRSISHRFGEKCVFAFYAEIQDGRKKKMAGKRFLGKVTRRVCRYPGGQKFCRNCSFSHHFQDKCILAFFMLKFKMAAQNGGKATFWENCHFTEQIP